ncbi:MAG: NAD-dependent epimerase/dehydratase family protein [Betaproteobacteria bacterium]|nr:NAD-dependent epimerase/dehydratase family protein [Betaproteobacteria bacterium]
MMNRIIQEDLGYIVSAPLPWKELEATTFLVTGATGFLGGYFVDVLLQLRRSFGLDIKIICLVRNPDKARDRFPNAESRELIIINADLNSPIIIDRKVDFIIHAASNATPKLFNGDPVGTALPNTLGTINLLTLAAKQRVRGFLFFSTTGVNGFVDDALRPIDETCFGGLDPMKVAHTYLESKRMGETLCVAWMHQYGVPIKVVRPAITYGPGIAFDDGRSYADFISCLVQKKDITLFSDGKAIRNFCYVADAILGIYFVLLKGEAGQAYNVATDEEISIGDLAEHLVKDVFPERNLTVRYVVDTAKDFLRVNFARTTVQIEKLKALGWHLSFPLATGFRRTVESYETGSEST